MGSEEECEQHGATAHPPFHSQAHSRVEPTGAATADHDVADLKGKINTIVIVVSAPKFQRVFLEKSESSKKVFMYILNISGRNQSCTLLS